jgi:hypothetical protein
MTDKRRHRGPNPADAHLFAPAQVPTLRRAVAESAWLLTRGYGEKASIKLVGDRHALTQRQRMAVQRASCSDAQRAQRAETRRSLDVITGRTLLIDGYNVLTSVEAALAGGVLLRCRDGCLRDVASMHGSFRRVTETEAAIERIGRVLTAHQPAEVAWLLDQPVSNSGRLKTRLREIAQRHGWPWRIEVVASPDALLKAAAEPIASADSAVLDAGPTHCELAGAVCGAIEPGPWIVDLAASVDAPP